MIPTSLTDLAICLNLTDCLISSGTVFSGSSADIGNTAIERSKPTFTGSAISTSRNADPLGKRTGQR